MAKMRLTPETFARSQHETLEDPTYPDALCKNYNPIAALYY